ncbi:hypothetical protein EPI10_005082 [Gossypium australe]|uniref:Uncharacterized protein n=1 Tax=Gossypium australe TaxID=47621 RepID=A0A5B6WMB6_9ROSI|nr:hypothetical protein EPI10_005082 [Gossypium australe]
MSCQNDWVLITLNGNDLLLCMSLFCDPFRALTILSISNLAKLEFVSLDITGKNYLSWMLDAEIHLDAKGLGETINEINETSSQDKAKAMIFHRHDLHEGLKTKYLTVKYPRVLWNNLKERYDYQKIVILPKALYD